ncbi:MAG: response regulator [Treponema sp.]|nr:response regulator [Treponema sp.]
MAESNLSVVILDDENHIIKLLEVLIPWKELSLTYAGCARNGIEGKSLIMEEKPDIIISDIKMPGLDGLSLISEIHDALPESEFIIISGFSQFDYAKTAITYGVRNYLLKPINKDELNATLKKIIAEKHSISLKEESNHRVEEKNLCHEFGEILFNKDRTDYLFLSRFHNPVLVIIKIDSDERLLSEDLQNLLQEKISDSVKRICCTSIWFYKYSQFFFISESDNLPVAENLKGLFSDLKNISQLFPQLTFKIFGIPVHDSFFYARTVLEKNFHLRYESNKDIFFDVFPQTVNVKDDKSRKILDEWQKISSHFFEAMDSSILKTSIDNLFLELQAVPVGTRVDLLFSAARHVAILSESKQLAGLSWFKEIFLKTLILASDYENLRMRFESELLSFAESYYQNQKKKDLLPIRLADSYMEEHYSDYDISLETVAEKVGLSASYLSALYKKETGIGFLEALTEVRISKAKTLLQDSTETVSKISKMVGYADVKYFSKIFKKITGIKPNEFRQFYS